MLILLKVDQGPPGSKADLVAANFQLSLTGGNAASLTITLNNVTQPFSDKQLFRLHFLE